MELKQLMCNYPKSGKVEWLGIRSVTREDLVVCQNIEISKESGILGDHYQGKSGKRQLTLIQSEHLIAVASMLNIPPIDPILLRRNIVVSGINLLSLYNQQFSIGKTILEGTGYCHPCSRMEKNLGLGGYNAMRGHGGITARVLSGGEISLGDEVALYSNTQQVLFN